jgi:hypothetical protein
MSLIDFKFKGFGVVVIVGDELYTELSNNRLFDKSKNQFLGNDKELDYLCKVVPGFEAKLDGHICDFIKVYKEK